MAGYIVYMHSLTWNVYAYDGTEPDWSPTRPVLMGGSARYSVEDTATGFCVPITRPPEGRPGLGLVSLGLLETPGGFPVEEIRPSLEKAVLARESFLTGKVEKFVWYPPS
jgi:hypothetical protein